MSQGELYLFPCFVCLFWACALLLNIRKNLRAQNIWILVMFCLAITMFCWHVYYKGTTNYSLYYKLDALETYTGTLYHVFILFYFLAVMDERPLRRAYLWLIPPLAVGTVTLVIYLLMGEEQSSDVARMILQSNEKTEGLITTKMQYIQYTVGMKGYYLIVAVQSPIMMGYVIYRLLAYRKRLKENFSNLEGKSLESIRNMIIFASLNIFYSLLGSLYGGQMENGTLETLTVVSTGILYFLMGHNVYNLRFTAETMAAEIAQADMVVTDEIPAESENESVADAKLQERLLAFKRLIDEEKIFLNSELRLADVVSLMQTNRTYISKMINEEYGCSFSDLINRKRIEYAKELALTYPNLSQEYIADKTGFLHTSSFCRVFKQQTGMTFREWCGKEK